MGLDCDRSLWSIGTLYRDEGWRLRPEENRLSVPQFDLLPLRGCPILLGWGTDRTRYVVSVFKATPFTVSVPHPSAALKDGAPAVNAAEW